MVNIDSKDRVPMHNKIEDKKCDEKLRKASLALRKENRKKTPKKKVFLRSFAFFLCVQFLCSLFQYTIDSIQKLRSQFHLFAACPRHQTWPTWIFSNIAPKNILGRFPAIFISIYISLYIHKFF